MNLLQYVSDFKECLRHAWQFAGENLKSALQRKKTLYDRGSRTREFKPGDEDLMLLPFPGKPSDSKFSGLYKVARRGSDMDHLFATPDRKKVHQLRMSHKNVKGIPVLLSYISLQHLRLFLNA